SKKLEELRAITPPKGIEILVGGTPALEQDSIHSLVDKAPLMVLVLISTTMVLMFLAFGSVVLPIKAAVMSVLTLGSTMGILTWIFIEGHGAGLLNFTPTPLMVVIIALVVAVGYGLATDYEVFLVSRMVEARENGMSTQESIRIGTATTGRLITAAALVLAVVAGSFVFSDLVMMKYLAFGLMAALLLDATVVRMFLVPSVMKLLGDDCWWAPRWMRRLQNRIGLGEIQLPDERKRPATKTRPPVTAGLVAAGASRKPHDPTHPAALTRAAQPELTPAPAAPSPQVPVRATPAAEPPTARLSAPGATRNGPAPRPAGRGPAPKNVTPPSAGETNKMPVAGSRPEPTPEPEAADKTAALPVQRPDGDDSDTATEKLNARGIQEDSNGDTSRRRRTGGGGLSAQDLLRREGRL
ncbi:MAG: hypothetical protein CK431_22810, partial [Mycobacterium sp.]